MLRSIILQKENYWRTKTDANLYNNNIFIRSEHRTRTRHYVLWGVQVSWDMPFRSFKNKKWLPVYMFLLSKLKCRNYTQNSQCQLRESQLIHIQFWQIIPVLSDSVRIIHFSVNISKFSNYAVVFCFKFEQLWFMPVTTFFSKATMAKVHGYHSAKSLSSNWWKKHCFKEIKLK